MGKKLTLEEHRLWVIFHQTHDLMTKYEDKVLESENITREQFLVLWLMEFMNHASNNPITITDLAAGLYRNVNSISALIDRMEKAGLIRKIRDLPDRREIRLEITEEGEERFNRALKPDTKIIKSMFSVLTKEEIQVLTNLLKRLKVKVNEDAGFEKIKMDPELSDRKKILEFLKKEQIRAKLSEKSGSNLSYSP